MSQDIVEATQEGNPGLGPTGIAFRRKITVPTEMPSTVTRDCALWLCLLHSQPSIQSRQIHLLLVYVDYAFANLISLVPSRHHSAHTLAGERKCVISSYVTDILLVLGLVISLLPDLSSMRHTRTYGYDELKIDGQHQVESWMWVMIRSSQSQKWPVGNGKGRDDDESRRWCEERGQKSR